MMTRFFARRSRGSIMAAAACNVGLATDDRLDAAALHRAVKRNGAEHVAMISHGTGFHPQVFDAFGEWLDLDGAIQQAIVGVQMQVYKLAVRHFDNCSRRLF